MNSFEGEGFQSTPGPSRTASFVSNDSSLGMAGRAGGTQEMDPRTEASSDFTPSSPQKSLSTCITMSNPRSNYSAAPSRTTETPSVAKILTTLLSIPSNRKCADCRAYMVDSSQTFASFSPALGKLPPTPSRRVCIEEFKYYQEAFAPVAQKPKNGEFVYSGVDPALRAIQLLGGHGVFICKGCAKAHLYMGSQVTSVKSVNDFSAWSLEQVRFVQQCGGNTSSWSIYEGFIPDGWQRRIPTSSSSLEQRLLFSRAKYEAFAFVTPTGNSVAAFRAWRSLVERDKSLARYVKPGCILTSLSQLSLLDIDSINALDKSTTPDSSMPDRFLDFFCVVGCTKKLYPGEIRKDLYAIESVEGLALEATVLDCYPAPNAYTDMDFPDQISRFVFPDGCLISETQKPPSLFTFVLTAANGYRLYGAALRIYDETMETCQLKSVLQASGYTVPMPWWLSDTSTPPISRSGKPVRRPSDIIFVPKCLVVISHYSFFHAFRQFLKQLYRLSILETPLPIERYIANFTSELPLPPQGKVEVKFGFMSDVHCTISRPAPNELPLAKFSFRPLFTTLSIGNILVIFGCLLQETKVVLVSQRYGLLTPCAEALVSFLFPFEWQGIYIPVMPYSLLDVLDAPVPFLVGLHARYLAEVEPKNRPKGVVFVDLDRDTVHLGYHDSREGGGKYEKRLPPFFPEKDITKLRSKLQEFAASQYIVPKNGIKGLMTHGDGECLQNEMREPYAHMEIFDPTTTSAEGRIRTLDESEHAYPENDGSIGSAGFFSEEGQLSTKKSDETPEKPERKTKLFTKLRAKIDRRQFSDVSESSTQTAPALTDLYNVDEVSRYCGSDQLIGIRSALTLLSIQNNSDFNVSEIRTAFLRFFTSIFNGYDKYTSNDFCGELFRSEDFLDEKNLSPLKRQWLGKMIRTQLFQRFLEERLEDPHDAAVLLFDEAIVAKNNRSMKKSIKQGKMTTPFLHDESWKISDSFTPPAPSNWGLPADGRRYSYSKFPRLNKSLFGTVRARKRWPAEWEQKIQRKGASRVTAMKRYEMLQTVIGSARIEDMLKGNFSSAKGKVITSGSMVSMPADQNLNWALTTLTLASLEKSTEELDVSPSENSSRLRDIADTNFIVTPGPSQSPDSILVAQEILLASRRKQGILIIQVIRFQALVRKFIHRSSYKRYAPALRLNNSAVQFEHLPFIFKSVIVIQCCVRWYLAVKRYRKRLSSVLRIQRNYRRSLERCNMKKVGYARLIQSHWRGILARRHAEIRRKYIIVVQSVRRGATARFAFTLVKDEIIKLQGHIRSYLTRKNTHDLLTRQATRYRGQIFLLWSRENTPLSYRAQMWSLFKTSFLSSRIMVDELQRLWKVLGIQENSKKDVVANDEVLSTLETLGCSVAFEWRFLHVSSVISSALRLQQGSNIVFPGEASDRGHRFARRIKIERVQVYERLNSLEKTSKLGNIYDLFGISTHEKKKKSKAIERLWNSMEHAHASATAMLLLFPELAEGIDIRQVRPSKKALVRLNNNPKDSLLDPLDKELWVDRKLDHLYRKNMSEVAVATLQTMPGLCVKLHNASLRKTASFRRRREARLLSQNLWNDWRDYKRAVIKKYLYG